MLVVACSIAGVSALRAVPGPDVSFLLYTAEQLVNGAELGTDIVEVNPPLIIWLNTLPAFLGGPDAYTALVLLTLAAIGCCLALTYHILKFDPMGAWITIVAGTGLLLLPQLDFGQREHLAATFTLPWIALAASRLRGAVLPRWLALLAAIVGSLGFLLKPYFLIPWVSLELMLVLHSGPSVVLRLENVVLVVMAAAYAVATLLLVPGFIELARLLGPAYSAYQTQGELEAVAAIFGVAVYFWYRKRTGLPKPTLLTFEIAAAGFLLAAVSQLKWWPYHFIPVMTCALPPLLLAQASDRGAPRFALRPSVIAPLAGAYLLFVSVAENLDVIIGPHREHNLPEPYLLEMQARIHQEPTSDVSVMAFSTNIQTAFPLVLLSGAHWSSRLPSLWPLSAAYADQARRGGAIHPRPLDERTELELWLTNTVVDDLRETPPDLIFVMKFDSVLNDSGGARRIDYVDYFSADRRFADLFAGYERDVDVGRYQVYRRSRRADTQAHPSELRQIDKIAEPQ